MHSFRIKWGFRTHRGRGKVPGMFTKGSLKAGRGCFNNGFTALPVPLLCSDAEHRDSISKQTAGWRGWNALVIGWQLVEHRNLPARVRRRQRSYENIVSLEVSWGRMGHCYAVMHSIVARQAKEAKQGVWDAFELPECAEYIEEDSTAPRVLFHLWFHG